MILEIPDELREAFISFLEFSLDDLLMNFGADLNSDEIQLAELLRNIIEKERIEG